MRDPNPTHAMAAGAALHVLRALALAGLLAVPTACGSSGGADVDPGAPGAAGAAGGMAGSGGSAPTGMAGAGGGGGGSTGAGGSAGAAGGGPAPVAGAAGSDAAGAGPEAGPATGGRIPDGGADAASPDTAPSAPPAPPPPPPWTELAGPVISVQGGAATSAGGLGQPGGLVHLMSLQDIALDPARRPPPAPVVPAAPPDAIAVTSAELGANVTAPRGVRVADATSGGADPVRTIVASAGDLFIAGTLRSADLGAARQGVNLSAPAGTVYVTGTLDTSGAADSGQAGGPITIEALRVVITGKVTSAGGDSATTAGAAGAMVIRASETLSLAGGLDAFGGNARGAGPVVGGKAGDVTLQAGGDLVAAGVLRLRGGAATGLGAAAQGGAAATLRIESTGAIHLGGIVDARAGLGSAAVPGGRVAGGAPGAVRVGEDASDQPSTVTVSSPVDATGGEGHAAGGKGGAFSAEPEAGNLVVAGARVIDVSGGSALAGPGAGGTVSLSATSESRGGGVNVQGEVSANGGHVARGGNGAGGPAGRINLQLVPIRGTIVVAAGAKLSAVGGRSGGAGVAGGGGHVFLFTKDGDLTVAGTIAAMGGEAPDPGGTGGPGGLVVLWSDRNGNADEVDTGNLLVATTGLVDASGGNGTIGGSARNDGISDTVAEFPVDMEKISILVDCDNVEGPTLTWLENKGRLVARGGAHNGSGGDIMFHGIMPDGEEPEPGNIDLAGDGTGKSGDFGSE